MNKTKEILALLKPIKVDKIITNFDELQEIVDCAPPLTMMPKDFYESAISKLPKMNIIKDGCWLLAGIWKGGSALFMKAMMADLKIKKQMFLYDTFGKIPINNLTRNEDITFANHFLNEKNLPILDYQESVKSLFCQYKLNNDTHFIKSDINSLVAEQIPENIALVHLDLDFFEPTYHMLTLVYDKIVPGGIIIIDDYFLSLFNCKSAVDEYFKKKGFNLNEISEKFSMNSILIKKS